MPLIRFLPSATKFRSWMWVRLAPSVSKQPPRPKALLKMNFPPPSSTVRPKQKALSPPLREWSNRESKSMHDPPPKPMSLNQKPSISTHTKHRRYRFRIRSHHASSLRAAFDYRCGRRSQQRLGHRMAHPQTARRKHPINSYSSHCRAIGRKLCTHTRSYRPRF